VSRDRLDPAVQQSVLERLIDREPKLASEPPLDWAESVALKRASVKRDLEWLLNTRRTAEPAPARFPEVRASVHHFGLPDLTSLSADSPETQQRLVREVEESIRQFEPRLSRVKVTARPHDGSQRHRVRFLVEALLRLDPEPERIAFDTVLEVTSGTIRLTGEEDA
jgi:type VI secretion system protein ImpF